MKQLFILLISVIVFLSAGFLSSCGKKPEQAPAKKPAEATQQEVQIAKQPADSQQQQAAELSPAPQQSAQPAVQTAAQNIQQKISPEPKQIQQAASPKPAIPHAAEDIPADALVIAARLVEIPGTFPPNDLYNYVYVMKYRVLSVIKGEYAGKEILIGHYNPLIARKNISDKMQEHVGGNVEKFTEGDKHRLVLITPIERVWKEAMEDEYFDSEQTKYYALKVDRMK